MKPALLIFTVTAVLISCAGNYYTANDFAKIKKVDTHIHINSEDPALIDLAKEDNFILLTVNVDSDPEHMPIDEQERVARIITTKYPEQVRYLSTFDVIGWPTNSWRDAAIARLKDSFDHGAEGIKIWKNIGIAERDSSGKFIMVDNPSFDPIIKLVIENNKTLLGHLGEPKNCWLPLEEMTVNNDRNYFKEHPEYHMYLHPEYPGYEQVIAARDHLLEKNPNLRFVGAHLGSLEYNLDSLARRLDKFPNMAVDMAARIPHLQYLAQKDRDNVRAFFNKYQDRIIYATDSGIEPGSNAEEEKKSLHNVWLAHWKFFTTDEPMTSPEVNGDFKGLKLEKKIIDKIYRENALRWFLISQGASSSR